MLNGNKIFQRLILIFLMILLVSCEEEKKYGTPNVDVAELNNDLNKWYRYHYTYIDLTSDFNALDEQSDPISKLDFIRRLQTGKFIPVKMNSTKSTTFYKLYEIEGEASEQMRKSIRSIANKNYKNISLIDTTYPQFSFTDINGNDHNSKELLGKYLILKFWFINCKPCVEEIPEMNFLNKKYQNQDAVFLSMAFDKKAELLEFLKDREYDLPTISVPATYISDTIGINMFPTHMIIDKTGKVVSVTNGTKNLRRRLKDIFEKP
jgi:peroxiredoxin